MPTASGAETLTEQLTRKRAELARVRLTIQTMEEGGQAVGGMGGSVTQVGYEQAQRRERRLSLEVAALEARVAGYNTVLPGIATIKTVMP
jgi:hypothetical protein